MSGGRRDRPQVHHTLKSASSENMRGVIGD